MKIDPSQINLESAAWVKVAENPTLGTITYELDLGDGTAIRRTDTVMDEALVRQNQFLLNQSEGKRWGDGQIAARIPMSVFFDQLGEANREGDADYMKKWLNDTNNEQWRTFKGSI